MREEQFARTRLEDSCTTDPQATWPAIPDWRVLPIRPAVSAES